MLGTFSRTQYFKIEFFLCFLYEIIFDKLNSLHWSVHGQKVTTPAELTNRITRLCVVKGIEGAVSIGRISGV